VTADTPEGQRFSHVYIDRGEPVADSDRMRVRMRTLLFSIEKLYQSNLLARELGVDYAHWSDFFPKAPLKDVLDLVTVSRRYLREGTQSSYSADIWLNGVQRIFSEENVHYRVDRLGGVHFKFDEEFERVTAAAISILQPRRYANFLDGFNQALRALAEGPPDGKGAIRATFTAIEGLFALMIPEVNRLAAGQTSRLRTTIEQVYPGDRRAQEAAAEMLKSLGDWIDAAHQYRHEQGKPDTVAQPPLTLAVYLVSTGASHLRWLAELDAAQSQSRSNSGQ
jgi:hypothetical protein